MRQPFTSGSTPRQVAQMKQREEAAMDTTHTLKKILVGALLSSAVAVAGLGIVAGTAQAGPNGGPYTWCPGQQWTFPPGPGTWGAVIWDMNRCHTYWVVSYGLGNVPYKYGGPSIIYEGDNPPAPHVDPLCPAGPPCPGP